MSLDPCSNNQDIGYTYALNVANGGVFTNTLPDLQPERTVITDANEAGVQTNATGSVYIVIRHAKARRTSSIRQYRATPGAQKINIPSNTKAKRLTWIERR